MSEKKQEVMNEFDACWEMHPEELGRAVYSAILRVIDEEMNGTQLYKEVEEDSGYDVSYLPYEEEGKTVEISDETSLKEVFEMPTGETVATYESGMGFVCETWGDEIYEAMDCALASCFSKHGIATDGDEYADWFSEYKSLFEFGSLRTLVGDIRHDLS